MLKARMRTIAHVMAYMFDTPEMPNMSEIFARMDEAESL
jgi:hypothetical protein